ncbi:MAG: hypothetical protein ACLU4Q_05930 [Streptococcus thermophilus]
MAKRLLIKKALKKEPNPFEGVRGWGGPEDGSYVTNKRWRTCSIQAHSIKSMSGALMLTT